MICPGKIIDTTFGELAEPRVNEYRMGSPGFLWDRSQVRHDAGRGL